MIAVLRRTTSAIGGWRSRHPLAADVALACALSTASVAADLASAGPLHDGVIDGPDLVATAIALGGVALRGRWPRQVLVGTAIAAGLVILLAGIRPVLPLAIGLIAYTAASRTPSRGAWTTAAAVAAGLYAVEAYAVTGVPWSTEGFPAVAWIGMTTALGEAARTGRAHIAEVEGRARHAEQTREEEAARRVVEERVRIARDLHDVVAHHIAVINVQAGAATHVLDRDPAKAAQALGHIRDACEVVLGELSSIVGVLRQSGDTDPPHRLDDLTALVGAITAAGLSVEREQLGTPGALPSVVDVAAYRIIQEALTNAHKHGTGTAHLIVAYTDEGVSLTVTNHRARTASRQPGSGYGLIGMRERAATAGGTLSAGPTPEGRFTVHAELPAPRRTP
ncbi:Signal transduction histidine kinase [Actinosynnema pretiosum]|nr:Signal transduction histidine kinase [Actinosynnema pretiosum]